LPNALQAPGRFAHPQQAFLTGALASGRLFSSRRTTTKQPGPERAFGCRRRSWALAFLFGWPKSVTGLLQEWFEELLSSAQFPAGTGQCLVQVNQHLEQGAQTFVLLVLLSLLCL
jgi:hypothetical protein